ncbi:MAG: molybdopterin synthase [Halobacteriota archaeon]
MQTLSVLGPGSTTVIADLADRLDGRVATIDRRDGEAAVTDDRVASIDVDPTTASSPDASFTLDGDGAWVGTGSDRTLEDLLDELAPDYAYALVSGATRPRCPTVVIGAGTAEQSGDVIERVDDRSELDLDAIAARLDRFEPYVTLQTLVKRVKHSPRADRSGAIATFTGRVRAKDSPDDSPTRALEFEKYEGVAADRLAEIRDELESREGVFEVAMHHRVGRIEDGEDIVFVVVLAGHRTEAFRTVEDGINRLKDEVPIFKKETTTDEEFWVHDRP